MRLKKLLLALGFTLVFSPIVANAGQPTSSISILRQQIVSQYLHDLASADYKSITQLFLKNGVVVSTSKGKVDAKEFFYGFLPEIKSASITTHSRFIPDNENPNKYAARFHFNFALKDGEMGEGEYMDEFVFGSGVNATKLEAVYMFENVKFPQ